MEKEYNKLVRDKIPNIIENNGETPIIEILTNERYEEELINKLFEESLEIKESSGLNRLEELSDLLELIKSLAQLENKELTDIVRIAEEKSIKRGSFKDKIYLKKVITSNNKWLHKHCNHFIFCDIIL